MARCSGETQPAASRASPSSEGSRGCANNPPKKTPVHTGAFLFPGGKWCVFGADPAQGVPCCGVACTGACTDEDCSNRRRDQIRALIKRATQSRASHLYARCGPNRADAASRRATRSAGRCVATARRRPQNHGLAATNAHGTGVYPRTSLRFVSVGGWLPESIRHVGWSYPLSLDDAHPCAAPGFPDGSSTRSSEPADSLLQ